MTMMGDVRSVSFDIGKDACGVIWSRKPQESMPCKRHVICTNVATGYAESYPFLAELTPYSADHACLWPTIMRPLITNCLEGDKVDWIRFGAGFRRVNG